MRRELFTQQHSVAFGGLMFRKCVNTNVMRDRPQIMIAASEKLCGKDTVVGIILSVFSAN
jgi:hypothetical protein